MKNRQMLSDGSSQNLDWNDLAVGADRIFVTWEDERDLLILYVDVFQYVWRSAQTIGSSNVTIGFGSEKELVTQAQLMSIPIQPEMFQEWRQLFSIGIIPSSCTSSTISWMRMEQLCYKQMFRTGRTSLISLPPLSGYGEHFPAPQLITSPFSINGISQLSSEKTSIPPSPPSCLTRQHPTATTTGTSHRSW